MKRIVALLCIAVLLGATDQRAQGTLGLGYTLHADPEQEVKQWLVVRGTLPDGPAAKAGILPNDLIVAINGKPLSFRDDVDLLDFFASIRAGDRVEATLLRGDEKRKVVLVAAAMTAEQQERWKQNYELARKKRKRAES